MERTCWVYRLFAADGELVYVGKSVKPQRRIRAHRGGAHQTRSKEWMERVTRCELTPYRSEEMAAEAEAQAILAERPTENREIPVPPSEKEKYVGRMQSGLKVRCTRDELDHWHRLADTSGTSLSDLVRDLLQRRAVESGVA